MPLPSERGGRLSRALVLAMTLLAAWPATADLPDPVKALTPGWQVLGTGEARFIGLHLYDASLWVAGQAMTRPSRWR